jgi:hypothetical protein
LSLLRILGLWGPVGAFMILVYALAGDLGGGGGPRAWDKVLHAGAYAGFGLLSLRAFHGGLRALRPWPTVLAMMLTLGYGAFDEAHQAHVPGREASWQDWVADAVGAGLSLLVARGLADWRTDTERYRNDAA